MSATPPPDAPPPNVAQIPLPPGMTLDQFETLQGSLVTLAIVTAVSFGVIMWDYFNLLPDEIMVYQMSHKKYWRTSASWAFVVLRYSAILSSLPALFFTAIQSDHCQVAVVISQVGVILVVASSGIIFTNRVFAMWSGHKPVRIIVVITFIIMVACWVSVASQYRSITGPHTPFGSNCQIEPVPVWSPISFASSVAFDGLILVLTLVKLNSNRVAPAGVHYLLYRDSLLYFVITAVTNTTVLIIEAQGTSLKMDLIKATTIPFSTLITVTMGTRVYLNLKLFNYQHERGLTGDSLPTSSTSTPAVGSGKTWGKLSRPKTASTNSRSTASRSTLPVQAYPIDITQDGALDRYKPEFAYDPQHSRPPTSMNIEMDDLHE